MRVVVQNRMATDATTVHFHGVHQLGTPFFDGAFWLTQAGIPPGGQMAYQFRAWPPGTHWCVDPSVPLLRPDSRNLRIALRYHAHASGQFGDGARGVLVVEDPADPYAAHADAEDELLVADLYEQTVIEEYAKFSAFPQIEAGDHGGESFYAALVNGRASVWRGRGNASAHVTPIERGHVARLRVVCAAWNFQFALEIEGHNMTVVAVQGSYVRPVVVDKLRMHSGERCDARSLSRGRRG